MTDGSIDERSSTDAAVLALNDKMAKWRAQRAAAWEKLAGAMDRARFDALWNEVLLRAVMRVLYDAAIRDDDMDFVRLTVPPRDVADRVDILVPRATDVAVRAPYVPRGFGSETALFRVGEAVARHEPTDYAYLHNAVLLASRIAYETRKGFVRPART